ncbi:MAG: hypothetical protein LBF70_02160, partial [Holosporales bacterium]|nr:hypothetical protein [Holosporales bacterium]
GGTDNITLQLIHISNSPHVNSVFVSKSSSDSVYSTSKKRKGKQLYIAIIALSVVLVVCGALFFVNLSKTGKDAKKIQPANVINEQPQKKVWETEVEKRGYKKVDNVVENLNNTLNIKEIFNEKGKFVNGVTFSGIIVYKNDEYYSGQITIYTVQKPYGIEIKK